MILKQVIHYAGVNAIEAVWVKVIQPAETIPAMTIPASIDPATGAKIEEQIIPEQHIPAVEQVVRCHTYMDVQMDMLVADLGADAPKYADLIAKVRAGLKPPPPKTPEQISAKILAQIVALEATQPRAIREAVLTGDTSRLAAIDAEIAALRKQLPKVAG